MTTQRPNLFNQPVDPSCSGDWFQSPPISTGIWRARTLAEMARRTTLHSSGIHLRMYTEISKSDLPLICITAIM